MRRAIEWIWNHGVISTFLSGLFAILPIVLTVAIVTWVAGYLYAMFGAESAIGKSLEKVGGNLGFNETTAAIAGWVLVLAGIWFLGLLVKSTAKHRVVNAFNALMDRIPIVRSVYSTANQLVGMIRKDDNTELKAMSAVFCSFAAEHGGGFLGLMTSPETYRFAGKECRIVYIPTSPLPMTGGLIFVPAELCRPVDMTAEQVMRIYFSLGILASQVVPQGYQISVSPNADRSGSGPG